MRGIKPFLQGLQIRIILLRIRVILTRGSVFLMGIPHHFNADLRHINADPRHFYVDPHHFHADLRYFNAEQNPAFHSMLIKIRLFTLNRIRILLPIQMMRICDHWSTDNLGHFEPKRLHLWASTSLHGSMFCL
jgi:hypothetical protein